jgi:tetratricopeptide (TPR) repeat protein
MRRQFALLGFIAAMAMRTIAQDLSLRVGELRSIAISSQPSIWTLELNRGECALLHVTGDRAFRVALRPADGIALQRVAAADSTIRLVFVSESDMTWQLELAAGVGDSLSCSVHWTERRIATSEEALRWRYEYAMGRLAHHLARFEATLAAEAAESAVGAHILLDGEATKQAEAYEEVGVQFALAELDSLRQLAEPFLQRALELRIAALGDSSRVVAQTFNLLSTYNYILGRFDRSVAFEERSLEILQTLPDISDSTIAFSRKELGLVYTQMGRYGQARAHFEAALAIWERGEFAADALIADTCNSLGEVARLIGDHAACVEYFDRAAALAAKLVERAPDAAERDTRQRFEALVWVNRAGLLYDAARYDEAESWYRQAIDVWRSKGSIDAMNLPVAMRNIAEICRIQGRHSESEQLFREAILVSDRDLGRDNPGSFWARSDLAKLLEEMGRFAESEALYREALGLLERSGEAGHAQLGMPLRGLADLYFAQGRWRDSIAEYERAATAFAAARGHDSVEVARAKLGIARSLAQLSPLQRAEIDNLLAELRGLMAVNPLFPELQIEIDALAAEMRHAAGDVRGAREDLAAALQQAEAVRHSAAVDDRSRAGYFADYSGLYRRVVQWSVDIGDADGAIRFLEQFRARVLLEQMQLARVDFAASLPATVATDLRAREQAAQIELAELAFRLDQPLSVEEEAALRRRRDAVARELGLVRAERRRNSPLWQRVTSIHGSMATRQRIQKELLDPREAMFLYQIGADSSLVIAVFAGTGHAAAHALSISIEQAQILGVASGPLTADKLALLIGDAPASTEGSRGRLLGVRGDDGPVALLTGMQRPAVNSLNSMGPGLRALFEVLVPESLRAALLDCESVILVPDGLLHCLPFEALAIGSDAENGLLYWLDRGPIVRYAPSASVLLSQDPRAFSGASTLSALSVCDPRFAVTETPVDSSRSLNVRGGRFTRLPGTALESAALVRCFPPGSVLRSQSDDATEGNVRAAIDRSILHFATHGVVENRRDDLYAALALTPGDWSRAGTEDDGFLQLEEIYELRLDAELVVLSACVTHTGDWIDGDGVFALSRGFLAAGARRIVGSLWLVDDVSTASLMGGFFERVATAASVRGAARMLRDAKLALRHSERFAHPYYWAAFVLVGAQ